MGKQNGSATLEARWQFVLNILYIWSSCPTSRYLLKEMKTYVYAKPCTQIFMAVLFIIARTLDCSFSMVKGLLFYLPPPSPHQLQLVSPWGEIGVGSLPLPTAAATSLSSRLHLWGKLSPTSCSVFFGFVYMWDPVEIGGEWLMNVRSSIHICSS